MSIIAVATSAHSQTSSYFSKRLAAVQTESDAKRDKLRDQPGIPIAELGLTPQAESDAHSKKTAEEISSLEAGSKALMCERYPDVLVGNSLFRQRLAVKLATARQNSQVSDPNRFFLFANEVATEMIAEGQVVHIHKDGVVHTHNAQPTPPIPAPTPTPAPVDVEPPGPQPFHAPAGSIARLQEEIAAGYHRVDPRTQTQARSGNREAQARLRYQQAQSQAEGDYNSGRTDAYDAEYASQRAAAAYEAELIRLQRERELAEIRRQNEELRRMADELKRRNSYR